jgi:UDP-glucose:(glucosyl)LPS alpha-1,3-glucosyltransferase/UDP-glucose:(galactosyl)LPS alpha-1,2-glucosyltransferase
LKNAAKNLPPSFLRKGCAKGRPPGLIGRLFVRLWCVFIIIFCKLIPGRAFRRNFRFRAIVPAGIRPEAAPPERSGERVAVAFCFDSAFAHQAAVTIFSLLKNSTCDYDLYCVCDDPLQTEELTKISDVIDRHGGKSSVTFLGPNGDFDGSHRGRWPRSIYYRCMLPALLPQLDSVIYADVDTLFLRGLSALAGIDFGDKLLAGVMESPGYVNSGFLAMNLKKIREEGAYQKLLVASQNRQLARNWVLKLPDQDLLNFIFRGRILFLPWKYNVIPLRMPQQKMIHLGENVADSCVMVHYAGKHKPWNTAATLPLFDLWRRHASSLVEEMSRTPQ